MSRTKINGDQLGDTGGAWTSFTAISSGITIGNGTSVGRYRRIGSTIHFSIRVAFGSTTSASGTFLFNLPVTAAGTSGAGWVATVYGIDTGVSHYTAVAPFSVGATTFACVRQNDTWSATVPFTWGNGDIIIISGTYEAP